MKKIENVYKEVLFQVLENQNNKMSQLELSKKLGISLSTVNFAIKKLEKINSIKINKMNFVVISPMRILYLWASDRNLEKDIIFKANINMSVREIERNLSNVIYAGYSSYKLKFNDIPADYSEVYVYADEKQLEEIKKRFKGFIKDSNNPNFFVLKKSNKDLYFLSIYLYTGIISIVIPSNVYIAIKFCIIYFLLIRKLF